MKLRFKYIVDRSYTSIWSHVEIEGDGLWTVDINEISEYYYNNFQDLTIEDFIKEFILYDLALNWDYITLNEEDLATLIVRIQNYETR